MKNIMKKTITFFTSLIVMILMSMTVNAQVLINEQFDYPVGDSLSGHGWATHGNLGVNTILTVSGNLSYTGPCRPSPDYAGGFAGFKGYNIQQKLDWSENCVAPWYKSK